MEGEGKRTDIRIGVNTVFALGPETAVLPCKAIYKINCFHN